MEGLPIACNDGSRACGTSNAKLVCSGEKLDSHNFAAGDGRQGMWEVTGHVIKMTEASEEVALELNTQNAPTSTTTGVHA